MSAGKRVGFIGGKTALRNHAPLVSNYVIAPIDQKFYLAFDQISIEDPPEDDPGRAGHGEGTVWPFGWGIHDLFKIMLRVKKWHIRADINYSYSVADPPPTPPDPQTYHWESASCRIEFDYQQNRADLPFHVGNGAIPDNEIRLLAEPIRTQGTNDVFCDALSNSNDFQNFSPASYVEAGDEEIEFTPLQDANTWTILDLFFTMDYWGGFADGDFWPYVTVSIGAQTGNGCRSDYLSDSGNTDFMGNVSLLDNTTSIYGSPIIGLPTFQHAGRIDSASLAITPKTYWAYANSNGEQVYDEATGARLVDPFS